MSLTTRDIAGALQRQHAREETLAEAVLRLVLACEHAVDWLSDERSSDDDRRLSGSLSREMERARRVAEDREVSDG